MRTIRLCRTLGFLVSTCGAMIPIDVDGKYVVDNHYIGAFEETLDYTAGSEAASRSS